MKLRKTFVVIMATSLFASPIVTGAETIENVPQKQTNIAQAQTLNDIQKHWAKQSIEYLVNQKILDGYLDGTFLPDKQIKREEAVKVMVKALKMDVKHQKSKFPDVQDGFWAEEYINVAKDGGIIKGYPDGSFGLGKKLTRGEMASILVRAFDLKADKDEKLPYPDVKETHWAYKDILTLYQNGVVEGFPDGTFGPEKEITRAEFALFVERILNSDDQSNGEEDGQQVTSIDFSITGNLEVGQEKPITFVLGYADGSTKDVTKEATYKVENTDIAVISNQKIKGLKAGKTKMTATYKDLVAEYYVEVVKPTPSDDTQQSGGSAYKDGEQKTIKGFVFTYHVSGNLWTNETGVSFDELPTFSDEVKKGKYFLYVPQNQYYDEDLYACALMNIAYEGLPLTKDEFINAYEKVTKTKNAVTINNITFSYYPTIQGEDGVFMEVK